jgi:hypothetical protein
LSSTVITSSHRSSRAAPGQVSAALNASFNNGP